MNRLRYQASGVHPGARGPALVTLLGMTMACTECGCVAEARVRAACCSQDGCCCGHSPAAP